VNPGASHAFSTASMKDTPIHVPERIVIVGPFLVLMRPKE
jgi:hypothetical protein